MTVFSNAWAFADSAVKWSDSANSLVTKNRKEFDRLRNDIQCIRAMSQFYAYKVCAAAFVLDDNNRGDLSSLVPAEAALSLSLSNFATLTQLTEHTYHFANSMQTGHRKIPFPGAANGVGTNYHWTQVLPLYEKELKDFGVTVAERRVSSWPDTNRQQRLETVLGAPIQPWLSAPFTLLGTNAETYEVKVGARPFADRKYAITELAPELNGLTGIRFSHEAAKNGRYVPVEFEVAEPVRVLIGYFQNERDLWLQVPNLDVASHADDRGGVDVVLRNAAAIEECPDVNVHSFRYEPGRHKLELIGKGSFVVLGVVPQSVKLEKRDAGKGTR